MQKARDMGLFEDESMKTPMKRLQNLEIEIGMQVGELTTSSFPKSFIKIGQTAAKTRLWTFASWSRSVLNSVDADA